MRLIDADALWEIIRTWQARLKPEHFITDRVKSDALNTVIAIIESQTTIEAEPVRHGRWVDGMPYTNSHWKVCSVCHKSADYPSGGDEYCGHCNAKMDEGADINVPDTQINGGAEDGHEQA